MLRFRNIDATPADPVEAWGVEGILTAIERGGLVPLRLVTQAVLADPWGAAADDLAQAVTLTDHPLARLLGVCSTRHGRSSRDPDLLTTPFRIEQ